MSSPGPGPELRIVVAMTTCDSGPFLQPQLDSIVDQDRAPDALVVSDDASTDGTLDLLVAFAASSAFPVTVIRNASRSGLHRNSAKALSEAAERGDVVVLAAHDDLWAREKLSAIDDAFAGRPDVSLWFSDADLIDAADRSLGTKLSDLVTLRESDLAELRQGGGIGRLIHGATISGPTLAVRADVISAAALPFPEDSDARYPYFYEDAWMALVARLLGEFATDHRCLVHYRRHPDQLSAQTSAVETERAWRNERREARMRERIATGLIASRIRDRPQIAWIPNRAEEVLALDSFLAARTMPVGTAGRSRALLEQLNRGSYSRFARGPRTFVADLVGL